jgi:hypothetical protein
LAWGCSGRNWQGDAPKLSPRGADGGIDEEFGRGEIGRWCAFVDWIVDAIATNSEPNAMFLFFLRLTIAAYVARSGAFVSWGNMQFGDEETCVSVGYVPDTLEELFKFVGETVCPNVFVFLLFHQVSIFKDIACVIVDDGANEVNGGVRGRGDCFQEDALSCDRISTIKKGYMQAK